MVDLFGSPNPVGEGRLGGGTRHLQSPPTSSRNHEVHMCGTFHYKCPDFYTCDAIQSAFSQDLTKNGLGLRALAKLQSSAAPLLPINVMALVIRTFFSQLPPRGSISCRASRAFKTQTPTVQSERSQFTSQPTSLDYFSSIE
jgi:hypothetical protein